MNVVFHASTPETPAMNPAASRTEPTRDPGRSASTTRAVGLPVLALWCLLAWLGMPSISSALEAELVSPAAERPLVAGSWVELRWDTPGSLPPDAEEWEAFFSFDGGELFSARLTPHLSLASRTATIRVPSLPTRDGRFLLRVGDEAEEIEIPVAGRYRIVVPDTLVETVQVRNAPEPGESARPGDPGVTEWVEGSREGRDLRLVRVASEGSGVEEQWRATTSFHDRVEETVRPWSGGSIRRSNTEVASSRPTLLPRPGGSPARTADRQSLLQTWRE